MGVLGGSPEYLPHGRTQAGDRHLKFHEIRDNLADLARPGPLQPLWAKAMANRRRKTLVVCASCHDQIHAGQPAAPLTQ